MSANKDPHLERDLRWGLHLIQNNIKIINKYCRYSTRFKISYELDRCQNCPGVKTCARAHFLQYMYWHCEWHVSIYYTQTMKAYWQTTGMSRNYGIHTRTNIHNTFTIYVYAETQNEVTAHTYVYTHTHKPTRTSKHFILTLAHTQRVFQLSFLMSVKTKRKSYAF